MLLLIIYMHCVIIEIQFVR